MNFASVLEVPCIFFCRNNRYAISTHTESQFHSDGIAPKAVAYGMEAFRIDGNDFFAVYDAVKRARAMKKPVLIEAMTYRLGAHSTSDDPSVYRKQSEVEEHQAQDPLLRLQRYLKIDPAALEEEIQKEITDAIEVAKQTPPPTSESMIEDVYFETPRFLKKQLEEASL